MGMRRFTITVNGVAYTVDVQEEAVASSVSPPAGAAPQPAGPAAPAPAPAPASASAPAEPAPGDTIVKAPMPGTVTKLVARVGQTLGRGDVILLLEAMKMQNEIGAPAAGILKAVSVNPGDTVKPGQVLAVIAA